MIKREMPSVGSTTIVIDVIKFPLDRTRCKRSANVFLVDIVQSESITRGKLKCRTIEWAEYFTSSESVSCLHMDCTISLECLSVWHSFFVFIWNACHVLVLLFKMTDILSDLYISMQEKKGRFSPLKTQLERPSGRRFHWQSFFRFYHHQLIEKQRRSTSVA